MSRAHRLLARRLRDFRAARAGVAAIEFALILPVMVLLYLGMTQVTLGLNMDRKVTILSRTVADLVGRDRDVSAAELDEIIRAATVVLEPYDPTPVTIVLSSVYVTQLKDGSLEGRVCWSYANANGVARAREAIMPIPVGFDTAQTSYVFAEVALPYEPAFSPDAFMKKITLRDDTAWPVRNAAEVAFSGRTCL
ncbi:TadE/TadG family type IV pilus assembly protein [Salinarimonas sp.]|uniref:TadE/TadG family type IV pilus assembly protein n=1 Tax=Salinarimonas sp. TaxID=2766526 RepID=UPI0032D92CA5